METIESTTKSNASKDANLASSALKKVTRKIVDSAPDEGMLADAAVSVASRLEGAEERVRNFDVSKVGPAIKALPWGIIGGVALAAGGIAVALNKKARRTVVSKVDDLLAATSFATTPSTKSRGKGKSASRSRGRSH